MNNNGNKQYKEYLSGKIQSNWRLWAILSTQLDACRPAIFFLSRRRIIKRQIQALNEESTILEKKLWDILERDFEK